MKLIHKVSLVLALLTLLGLAAGSPVQAQVTEYLNRTAFTAASSNLTTLDFANANPGGGVITEYNTAAGLTLGGVNFVGTVFGGTYTLAVPTPDFSATYQGWSGNPTVLTNGGTGVYNGNSAFLTINLPTGTTSVGMNLYTTSVGDYNNPSVGNFVSPVSFSLFSGTAQVGLFNVSTFGKPTLAFAGFKSSQAITSVQITEGYQTYVALSNFSSGPSANPVPETSTTFSFGLLLCLGLGGLVVNVRRRKVQSAK